MVTTARRPPPGSVHLQAMARCPLFSGLQPHQLADIGGRGTWRDFRPGQRIVDQGETPPRFFVVLSGAVRIFMLDEEGLEVTVKLLAAPSSFGESAIVTKSGHLGSAAALRRSLVLEIERAVFLDLLDRYPSFTRQVFIDLCHRFRISATNEGSLAFRDVQSRLAALLLSYARTLGQAVAGGVQIISAEITQEKLAQGLAATRKSVQRTLLQWSRQGLFERRGKHYVLLDLQRLSQIAGESATRHEYSMQEWNER